MWPWSQVSSCSLLPPVLSKCHLLSLYESAAYLLAAVDRAIAHIWFLSLKGYWGPAVLVLLLFLWLWLHHPDWLDEKSSYIVKPSYTACTFARYNYLCIKKDVMHIYSWTMYLFLKQTHSYFSSPRIMWPSIQRGLLPSLLGRIWTKLAFLRSSGICGDESNYYDNKVACVMCVRAIQNLRFMWSDAARHPNTFWKISCLWVDNWNWTWCKAVESFICIWLKLPTAWRSSLN